MKLRDPKSAVNYKDDPAWRFASHMLKANVDLVRMKGKVPKGTYKRGNRSAVVTHQSEIDWIFKRPDPAGGSNLALLVEEVRYGDQGDRLIALDFDTDDHTRAVAGLAKLGVNIPDGAAVESYGKTHYRMHVFLCVTAEEYKAITRRRKDNIWLLGGPGDGVEVKANLINIPPSTKEGFPPRAWHGDPLVDPAYAPPELVALAVKAGRQKVPPKPRGAPTHEWEAVLAEAVSQGAVLPYVKEQGFEPVRDAPNDAGWVEGKGIRRDGNEDEHPSAGVNVKTGVYKDHGDGGPRACNVVWLHKELTGCTFDAAVAWWAERLRMPPPKARAASGGPATAAEADGKPRSRRRRARPSSRARRSGTRAGSGSRRRWTAGWCG
jgi:hypothetical protein